MLIYFNRLEDIDGVLQEGVNVGREFESRPGLPKTL